MKTKITLLIFLFVAIRFAQNSINYEALIKDNLGNIVVNDKIEIRFTVSAAIIPIYQETHSPTTDSNGIIVVNIGDGKPVIGVFETIDWASAPHTLQVEVDTGGGFINLGTTPFKHVPYALASKSAQTNAIVTFPGYLDTNWSDFSIISGGRIRVVFEFNIQMDPSTFVVGTTFIASGSGGTATGTLQWTNGNTRLVFTSNEAFTTIAPCFSGGYVIYY